MVLKILGITDFYITVPKVTFCLIIKSIRNVGSIGK